MMLTTVAYCRHRCCTTKTMATRCDAGPCHRLAPCSRQPWPLCKRSQATVVTSNHCRCRCTFDAGNHRCVCVCQCCRCDSFVYSIVLGIDVIPRLSIKSLFILRDQILTYFPQCRVRGRRGRGLMLHKCRQCPWFILPTTFPGSLNVCR